MLEAIIIDNEKPAIDILTILLKRTGQMNVVQSFLSAEDALLGAVNLKPDVAFLDIEMPGTNGLDLAEKLLAINSNMDIIFVTAYEQYALKAFRVNALDYLLKPLSFEDVNRTVARVLKTKGTSTDFSEKPLSNGHIHCFGKLAVYSPIDGQHVKWRTSKAEELFAFMLQNLNVEVSKWKICENLWSEYDMDKISIYLHTTIYKMKKVLTAANINFDFKFINGCYKLTLHDITIDTKEFDDIVDSDMNITTNTLEKYEKAFALYKGNFLEENSYLWSLNKMEEYFNKYRSLAASLAEYYINNDEYAEAERILRTILTRSSLDDFCNEMLLNLYLIKKDRVAFITHYNLINELYKTELGIAPSIAMESLYQSMLEL